MVFTLISQSKGWWFKAVADLGFDKGGSIGLAFPTRERSGPH